MQNDVEIEQWSRINQQKNEKLKKMKMNIQKLQMGMNMSKNFRSNKPNTNHIPEREPANIIDHYSKQYSSASPVNTDKDFAFNSNLFRNINESQPILENGSAVSNFSSVSNINNLLNGRLQQQHQQQQERNPSNIPNKPTQRVKQQNNILSQIDSLLERTKKAKVPIKAFEKYIDIIEAKQSKTFSQIEEVQSSRYSDRKNIEPPPTAPAKTKLQEYKKFIDKLETIPEQKIPNQTRKEIKPSKNERSNSSNLYEEQQLVKEKPRAGHKRSELSNFSSNSQFVESYPRLPPHPSGRAASNPVDRHRFLIQQTFQERKKLQTEVIHHNLDQTQIDLELSDEQSEQAKKEKQARVEALLEEQRRLMEELETIEKELDQLQNSD